MSRLKFLYEPRYRGLEAGRRARSTSPLVFPPTFHPAKLTEVWTFRIIGTGYSRTRKACPFASIVVQKMVGAGFEPVTRSNGSGPNTHGLP
ncbi:hypothetical protein CROQUDRAFT_90139 [Cronartium quercuum f. sp. fusiforme G11]|uniref:Uncharacterized protein n=1 Tax=Cronartium quercuum f. sp. fusiforme G11 TaxID=708437 RepID=A0A9P6TED5_9BASI|nr:hypothetical protein CROQUDRAFT_90139 [Cronartium quercuum f. sp. fusiforme G11]